MDLAPHAPRHPELTRKSPNVGDASRAADADAGPMAERDTSDQRGTTAIDWVMLAALAFSVVVLATTFGGTWFGGVA